MATVTRPPRHLCARTRTACWHTNTPPRHGTTGSRSTAMPCNSWPPWPHRRHCTSALPGTHSPRHRAPSTDRPSTRTATRPHHGVDPAPTPSTNRLHTHEDTLAVLTTDARTAHRLRSPRRARAEPRRSRRVPAGIAVALPSSFAHRQTQSHLLFFLAGGSTTSLRPASACTSPPGAGRPFHRCHRGLTFPRRGPHARGVASLAAPAHCTSQCDTRNGGSKPAHLEPTVPLFLCSAEWRIEARRP